MVVRTIIAFFVGMTLLAMTLVVVETVWIVALVGFLHIAGSAVLGVMIVRHLSAEERSAAAIEKAGGSPPSPSGR